MHFCILLKVKGRKASRHKLRFETIKRGSPHSTGAWVLGRSTYDLRSVFVVAQRANDRALRILEDEPSHRSLLGLPRRAASQRFLTRLFAVESHPCRMLANVWHIFFRLNFDILFNSRAGAFCGPICPDLAPYGPILSCIRTRLQDRSTCGYQKSTSGT